MSFTNQDFEKVVADYFDDNAVLCPDPLYRFNLDGSRYYTDLSDIYPSCTTVLDKVVPLDPALIDWRVSLGSDYWRVMKEKALYGTTMHGVFSKFLIRGVMGIDDIIKETDKICSELDQSIKDRYYTELMRDLAGFAVFCREKKVSPILIEVPVKCSLGYGSAVDLVCFMEIEEKGFFGEVYKTGEKKGQPKESKQSKQVLAVIDWKSGRNGGGYSHEAQLKMYELALKELEVLTSRHDLSGMMLFNYHPKDWITEPGYSLIDQTGKVSDETIKSYMHIYFERFIDLEKRVMEYDLNYVFNFGDSPAAFPIQKTLKEAFTKKIFQIIDRNNSRHKDITSNIEPEDFDTEAASNNSESGVY